MAVIPGAEKDGDQIEVCGDMPSCPQMKWRLGHDVPVALWAAATIKRMR